MVNQRRTGPWAFGLALASAVVLGAPLLAAEEPAGGKPADSAPLPALKKTVDPSRRVPAFFGQVGLTAEQKEEIYKIRARRQAQIEALHKQLSQVNAEVLTECETVLNHSQKQLLALRRDAAAQAKAAKAASVVTPVSSRSEPKPGN